MRISKINDAKLGEHQWAVDLSHTELDNFIAGMYFMDKEGVAEEPLNSRMIELIEATLDQYKQKPLPVELRNVRPRPHFVGLTQTQRDQVQKMIEAYALKVEKRRAETVKRLKQRLDVIRSDNICTDKGFTAADLIDDDNTEY